MHHAQHSFVTVFLITVNIASQSFLPVPKQGQQPISPRNLLATSVGAGSKIRELLRKFDVQYNDDSNLHGRLTTWVGPWNRFLHQRSTFERVRGCMENVIIWLVRFEECIGDELCHFCAKVRHKSTACFHVSSSWPDKGLR